MTESLFIHPNLQAILNQITAVSSYLWEKGWAEKNAGNLSVDVTDLAETPLHATPKIKAVSMESSYPTLGGRSYIVTGTGNRFRDCAACAEDNVCILRLDEKGAAFDILWGGNSRPNFRPTSEFPSHLRIHEFLRGSGARETAVLHTHPPELVAMTHLPRFQSEEAINRALWAMHPEVRVFVPKGVGLAPYVLPGGEKLAQATVEAFGRNHRVALWQMHGVVALGETLMDAFDLIDSLNKAAKMLFLCLSTGQEPLGLKEADFAELDEAFGNRE